MGIFRGSLSYLRLLVEGAIDTDANKLERALEARRFLPLSPSGDTMDSAGWVPTEAPFDDERPITRDVFAFGGLVAVTYREDRYAIPKPLLARALRRRLDEIAASEGRAREDMGRAFIKAVEGSVLAELKQKSIPRSRLVDVLLDTSINEVRVFGRGATATERVMPLLERTFGVRLTLASYPARAFTTDLDSRALAVLDRLSTPGWIFPS